MKLMIGILSFLICTNAYSGVVDCEPWKSFTSYTCDVEAVIQSFEKNGNCQDEARKAAIDLFISNTSIDTYKNADVKMELIKASFNEDLFNINAGINDMWLTNWKMQITYNTGDKLPTSDLSKPAVYFYQKVDIDVEVSGWAQEKCVINSITAKNILKYRR